MSDASSENPSLEDLPEKKDDLKEARQLLDRLEDRKDETDPERYEHLRQRYEEKIEELEPVVERLTEEGETRKLELENRLFYQRDRIEEAEAELEEIEALYEESAMDEETYREERRRFEKQQEEAEKKASQIEEELEEVEFYLTETGEVSYQKEQVRETVQEGIDQAQETGEAARNQFMEWGQAIFGSRLVGWSVAGVLLLAMGYWLLGGYFGGPPSERKAGSKLQELISERSEGMIRLVELSKVGSQKGEMSGILFYTMGVEVRIEIQENCFWNPPDLIGLGRPFTVDRGSEEESYFKRSLKGEQHAFTGTITFEEKELGWNLSEVDLQVQRSSHKQSNGKRDGGAEGSLNNQSQNKGTEPNERTSRQNRSQLDFWRTTETRWWQVDVDTSQVFPNLDSLTTMGVVSQQMSTMQGREFTRGQFNVAIKESLLRLYRNNPAIVDSLFEEYAKPQLEGVNLSESLTGKNGQLKPRILNENQIKAYQAITEYFREPQREKFPDRIIWPDSLRSEENTGIVKLQVHLTVEGNGENAISRADAVELLSGTNPTLNKIAIKAATNATWQPAYLLKNDRWTPIESWVRFNVPFQMR
jgi:hypothetical protein